MEQIKQTLALMDRPAFCAADGRILALNTAARALSLAEGMEVLPLLSTGREAYLEFTEGCLCLELALDGGIRCASITAMDGHHLFVLEPTQSGDDLRMMSLAAQALRDPLSNVMALVDTLPVDTHHHDEINRSLYRILRIVGNMTPPLYRPELMDLNALLQEVWDHSQPACDARGMRFTFVPSLAPVYSLVDSGLMTRVIHNLLSNAMKFSSGGQSRMELLRSGNSYKIRFWVSGASLPADPFNRYLREPGLEDPKIGLGLGLHMVRTIIEAHGGSILMVGHNGGLLTEMRLPINQNSSTLRSNRLRISYTGERDPLLVELSDVLPKEFYK